MKTVKNEQLNNTRKYRTVKVKSSSLESENTFKSIKISIDDMHKFEEKEPTKK